MPALALAANFGLVTIHTYYEEIPQFPHERPLLDLWAASWRRNGWTPVILTRADAARHPLLETLEVHALRHLPTINHRDYELACYRRWCAFQAAGGGWMADYDVLNYTLTPEGLEPQPSPGPWMGLDNQNPSRLCPCFVGAGPEACAEAIGLFLAHRADEADRRGDRFHTSDQTILRRHAAALQARGRLHFLPLCGQYRSQETAWKTMPAVHFGNTAMIESRKMPRHLHLSLDPAIRLL